MFLNNHPFQLLLPSFEPINTTDTVVCHTYLNFRRWIIFLIMQVKFCRAIPSLARLQVRWASFAKYDHTDALNFKSLLTEDELIVFLHPYAGHRYRSAIRADAPFAAGARGLQGGDLRQGCH